MPRSVNHVIVLMLENRSFDHLLGFMRDQYPPGTFDGLVGDESNPDAQGAAVKVSRSASAMLKAGPDHGHRGVMHQLTGRPRPPAGARITNDGFVRSYAARARDTGHAVMKCFDPAGIPVTSALARAFVVCDRWFCSVPGETWPNRNYVHAATSDGEVNIEFRPFSNRTIFELLEHAGHEWAVYHRGPPQLWAFPRLWESPFSRSKRFRPLDDLPGDIRAGHLPTYTFVEPDHGLLWPRRRSNSQHPANNADHGRDFYAGEHLVLEIYSALLDNPALWNDVLWMLTYDEHGGFYDHVHPPRGTKPAGASGRPAAPGVRLRSSRSARPGDRHLAVGALWCRFDAV